MSIVETESGAGSAIDIAEAELLSRAADVFRHRGFLGTSIQQLVDATGSSRSALYGTFGDKSGLFLAALTHYCATDSNLCMTPDASKAPLADFLALTASEFARDREQSPCLLTRSCSELDQLPEGAAAIVANALKAQWNELIEAVSTSPNPDEHLTMATVALVTRHGIATLASGGIPSEQLLIAAQMVSSGDGHRH